MYLDSLKIRENEFNRRLTMLSASKFAEQEQNVINQQQQKIFKPKRLYRTEIEISNDFASKNIGRFSCKSAFGTGAIAELEPVPKYILAPIQIDYQELKTKNQQQHSIKLSWKKAQFISGTHKQRKNTVMLVFDPKTILFVLRRNHFFLFLLKIIRKNFYIKKNKLLLMI